LSGLLCASISEGWVALNFPTLSLDQIPVSDQIIQALGFTPKIVFKTDVNILVEMENPEAVEEYIPDFLKMAELPYQGLIITAEAVAKV
jgi:hypothetical protein